MKGKRLTTSTIREKSLFSENKQKEVIKNYLKGVPLENLTLQYNCSKNLLEQILANNGMPVVDNKVPSKIKKIK